MVPLLLGELGKRFGCATDRMYCAVCPFGRFLFFTAEAELANGRAAMLGIVGVFLFRVHHQSHRELFLILRSVNKRLLAVILTYCVVPCPHSYHCEASLGGLRPLKRCDFQERKRLSLLKRVPSKRESYEHDAMPALCFFCEAWS